MTTTRPEITGREAADSSPLAVTVQRACELSGLGPTSIWAFLKDGRLEAVRVRGIRRTLVSYPSLVRLLAPPSCFETDAVTSQPPSQKYRLGGSAPSNLSMAGHEQHCNDSTQAWRRNFRARHDLVSWSGALAERSITRP